MQKNSTPSLTQRQAIALLEAIPTDTPQGVRDFALMSVVFLTGCRVSAVIAARVGDLEHDGVEHYLHVTEKRDKKRRKILLDAARAVRAYVEWAGIGEDREGPLTPDGLLLVRRHLDRKTPWRLLKKYCQAAGIDPNRLGQRGIGIHSLRKTAINDAIRNGAQMHEVREFAGYPQPRITSVMETHSLCGFETHPRHQIKSGKKLSPHNDIDAFRRPLKTWLLKHAEARHRSRMVIEATPCLHGSLPTRKRLNDSRAPR